MVTSRTKQNDNVNLVKIDLLLTPVFVGQQF